MQVDIFHPLEIYAPAPVTIINTGKAAVYYRAEPLVSASLHDGELAAGASVTVTQTTWFIAAAPGAQIDYGSPHGNRGEPYGSASLGADGTVGGTGGSPLSSSVVNSSAETFNVKTYGAKGDGVTNDALAIKAADKAAAEAGGGVVWFPPGSYKAEENLEPSSHNTWAGAGLSSGIALVDDKTTSSRNVYIDKKEHVTIRDLSVTQTGVTGRTGVYGLIRIWESSDVTIDGCWFGTSSATAIWLGVVTDFTVTRNKVYGPTYADGIHLSRGCARGVVSANRVTNTQDDMIAVNSIVKEGASSYQPCRDITIVGNVTWENSVVGSGIAVYGGIGITIAGNVVVKPIHAGIPITTIPAGEAIEHATCSDITITGNTVRELPAEKYAIWVDGEATAHFTNITVTANVIDATSSAADAIHATYTYASSFSSNTIAMLGEKGAAILLGNCSECVVAGNAIKGNGGTTMTTTGIFLEASADCNVTGNVATKMNVGAWETGGGGPNQWVGNDFRLNHSFSVGGSLNATSVFKSNLGYNPRGMLEVAVPASGVAIAAAPYDRTFYVTAATGGCTMAIQNGPSVVVPQAGMGAVRVPAGLTVTPTYTNAPTWVVEGE